jgi:hypothetical protein
MFGLFKSNSGKVKVIDKVWASRAAKLRAAAKMLEANPSCLFIAWFPDTYIQLRQTLNTENVLLAENANAGNTANHMVIFAEHYPLPDTEQRLFEALNLKEAPVLIAIDEPLIMHFGGENIVNIMSKLGMTEDEMIGHSFITAAIRNAQEKIGKRVKIEQRKSSAEEWFKANLGTINN